MRNLESFTKPHAPTTRATARTSIFTVVKILVPFRDETSSGRCRA